MKKKIFLTVDIEEWYHLDYLKKYKLDKDKLETIPKMHQFLDMLDRLNIKATFFTLGEIAEKHSEILKDIQSRGHAIGCHGLDHELLYNKRDLEFKKQIIKAKKILESILGKDTIKGYRASCFSMDRKKLEILKQCGYKYDSSYICFAQHPLYGKMNLEDFEKIDDLIYKQEDFFEFEIPTFKFWKFNIPISGGGYLRLFPYQVISILIKKYLKKHNNFVFYLHPFELTEEKLPFPKDISIKDRFRASVGRKGNLKKLEKILKMLIKNGAEFYTFEQVMKNKIVR